MGRLIVIDGLDGSGKSTQLERLGGYLTQSGIPYKQICFPDYDQPSSALVKLYLSGAFGDSAADVNAYAASSFYAVDRFASYKSFWQADYETGALIVAARYTTSNAIHQMSKLPQEEWDGYLNWLEDYEYDRLGLPRPDAVLFLDMPPQVSQRLLSQRYHGDESKKDIHERDRAYLLDCRRCAQYAASRQGWRWIDCSDGVDPLPVDTITERIVDELKDVLRV
ncbi:MAG: dTMP kinase [Acutalibacteraceae bacterium]|jgi:dTMP kinase